MSTPVRAILIILTLVAARCLCFSQTTVGPNNPSAAADGGGGSGGVPTWSTASGTPYTSDNTYATIVSQLKSKNTNYLHITGFGFSVPVGSYISGIKVEVEMFGTVAAGATNRENSIMLINSASTRVGTDHSTGAAIATADPNSYVTYGGSSDTWGGALTYADVNSPNFGVAIQYTSGSVNNTAGNYNFNVDHVRVTITYAPGYDAVVNGCFNDGATWGRVSPGTAGIDYPDATIAANIPGGKTVTVCAGTTANCFALVMNSDFSPNLGAVLTLTNSTATLNVASDIVMGTTVTSSTSFTAGQINITGGTIVAQGNLLMTANRNPPNNASQAVVFGGGTLTVNGDAIMTANSALATTTLNMTTANSVFNLGGDLSLGTGASLTNGAGTTGTINYTGSNPQIVRGSFTYFNLTYSGGGLKSLEAGTQVNGTLNLTSGNCDMGGLTLTLGSSTASKGTLSYTSGSLYDGTFKRWFDNSTVIADGAVAGLFPVGNPTDYRPFNVYFNAAPSAGGTLSVLHDYNTPGVTTVAFADGGSTVARRTNMFWTLTAANSFSIAAGNENVRIGGSNIGSIGVVTPIVTDLRITLAGSVVGTAGVNGGTTSIPIVRRINMPAFTASTISLYIGSVDAVNTPLPIGLTDFKAIPVDGAVELNWITASEQNNDFFTVERSLSGENFSSVGQLKGQGTTIESHTYKMVDTSPVYGTSYYRLKQTDFDKKFTYSKIIAVKFDGLAFPVMTVYPNPSNGTEMNIEIRGLKNDYKVPVVIYDLMGKECKSLVLQADENSGSVKTLLTFEKALPAGVYIVRVGYAQAMTSRLVVIEK